MGPGEAIVPIALLLYAPGCVAPYARSQKYMYVNIIFMPKSKT